MTENEYILVQRLTQLKAADRLLREAGVHLTGERAQRHAEIVSYVTDQIALDYEAVRPLTDGN